MTSGLVSDGIWYLEPNEWDVFTSFRYLHSDTAFLGGDRRADLDGAIPHFTTYSIDLGATYAITRRFSASLILPFSYGEATVPEADGHRHSMSAGGLGDVRLLGNVWLLDPAKHTNQNLSLSLGFKAPTGDHEMMGDFYTPNGVTRRAVVPVIQPGDGGWGMIVEIQGFAKLIENLFLYAGGFYLSTPQEQTDTPFALNPKFHNSIPDEYSARLGLQYSIWPEKGLALSLGGRFDGVPAKDLIGGSQGFRTAGYAISIEPGISWTFGRNAISVSAPVAIERHDEDSVFNSQLHNKGQGGFADFLILASYQRRF